MSERIRYGYLTWLCACRFCRRWTYKEPVFLIEWLVGVATALSFVALGILGFVKYWHWVVLLVLLLGMIICFVFAFADSFSLFGRAVLDLIGRACLKVGLVWAKRNCDNRKENLRFLCPNCHSQQATNQPWKNSRAHVVESHTRRP